MNFIVGNRISRTRTTRFQAQIENEERLGEKLIAVAQAGLSVSFLLLHTVMCLSEGHSVLGNSLTIGLIVLTFLSVVRFSVSQNRVLKPGLFNILTILEGFIILVLIISYTSHYGSIHQIQYSVTPIFIMSAFVGLRALKSDPVQVIFAGATIIVGLAVLVMLVPIQTSGGFFSWIYEPHQVGKAVNISSLFESIVSMAVLTAVITVGVIRARRLLSNSPLMDDLRDERNKVKTLSSTDFLTELANRAEFKRRLEKSIQVLTENSRQSAVMVLDLDRFKMINDTIGHPEGDKFLRQLGQRLKESVRDTDLVARLGGDEFAILLENIKDIEAVEKLSGRLTGEINKTLLASFPDLQIDTSVGISIAPQDGVDAEQLIGNAEIALAKSKEKGRGYCTIFNEEFRKNIQHENALEKDLLNALKNDQLKVFFQPKYNFQSGSVNSVEALIRWQHPEKGLISPNEFIPAAERSGLIVDIGQFVLAKTCDFIHRAEKEKLVIDRIAINVAAREFMSDNSFSENLMKTIRTRDVSPRKIELEITEQVLLDRRSEHVFDMFDRLRSEGVHISLDDFGTGYASLIHLASCPINAIKLDRSFVAGINTNKRETAIVSAISRMAKELDLQITAEGVETLEQFEFVRHSGCDFVQGYYVARPLHEDHLVDFLKYHNSRLYSIAV